MAIQRYESMTAALSAVEAAKCSNSNFTWGQSDSWAGDSGEALKRMILGGGDDRNIAEAMTLLDRLLDEMPETDRRHWVGSVVGGRPCVPSALSGRPKAMRRMSVDKSLGAPIKVGCITTISAGINHKQFQRKAVCLLAVVMHLANSGRPVELWGLNTVGANNAEGEEVIMTKIDTAPLSLSQAGMVLANIGYTRRLGYSLGAVNGFNGGWPRGFDQPSGVEYGAKLAKRLGFNMVLPALHLGEANAMEKDPLAWTVTKYREILATVGEVECAA